jgi:hypothetical protein
MAFVRVTTQNGFKEWLNRDFIVRIEGPDQDGITTVHLQAGANMLKTFVRDTPEAVMGLTTRGV